MIGNAYWTTGISLECNGDNKWSATLNFFDSDFCEDESTEGKLYTRYYVALDTALDVLIADAKRLGIEFKATSFSGPFLYYKGDGEWEDYPPPPNWKNILQKQAERVGFVTYSDE